MAVDSKILAKLSEDASERGNISNPYMVEWALDTFPDYFGVSSEEINEAIKKLSAIKHVTYCPIGDSMGSITLTKEGYDYYQSEKYKPKIGF